MKPAPAASEPTHGFSYQRILLPVHDDIVGGCSRQETSRMARLVTPAMEKPVRLPDGRTSTVPAEIAISSRSWADTKELEVSRRAAA